MREAQVQNQKFRVDPLNRGAAHLGKTTMSIPAIPTYDQWKRDTSLGLLKPRSAQMQALDQAIEKYNQTKKNDDLWTIKNAFEDWKRAKGPGWVNNERNRTKALSSLNGELDKLDYRTYQITRMSIEELKALEDMRKERTKLLKTQFQGKQVKFKAASLPESLKLTANNVKAKCNVAVQAIKNKVSPTYGPKPLTGIAYDPRGGLVMNPAVSGRSVMEMIHEKLTEMVKSFFKVDTLADLGPLSTLIMSIVAECAKSTAPVIGHIKGGVGAVGEWIEVGVDLYKKHGISERSYSIDTGAPAAAFAALEKCLKEETGHAAIGASISSTSFVVKTGLLFVDGGTISGPVTGAVEALAQIAHKLYMLGMEYRATQAINDALKADKLDMTLFKTYPLMGCYVLNCSTLSDIVPIECFGTPGWKQYIANMKTNAIDEIIRASTALIDKSPWEIQGMPKRRAGPSGGLFSEVKRFGGMAAPLRDFAELRKIGKTDG